MLLENFSGAITLPYLRWDDRSRQWRAKAVYYARIIEWLRASNIDYADRAQRFAQPDLRLRMRLHLRDYQKEALRAWQNGDCCGSVCLPTGSGKTWVALMAMQQAATSCMIVLPTIDLLNQWYDQVADAFGVEVGILGGGYHDVRPVTVTTYDSAYRHIDKYGDRFGLLIFDEVHHLPAATYSHIPEMSLAPYRLGLTATYERTDGLHGKLARLIGPMVYNKSIKDLEGKHLADYEIMRIAVDLTPDERRSYDTNLQLYENYVRESGITFSGPDMAAFIQKSAFDPQGRKAFLARLESRRILISAQRKLEILETLLKRHHGDQILIFTESNDLVYEISRTFLIPALTHHTRTIERKQILDAFRNRKYSVLVTSKVLNEGVDVPGANVAIILGGSASPVEHVQRLGRILRKDADKQAILYELVTRGTRESQVSYRRRRADAYQ